MIAFAAKSRPNANLGGVDLGSGRFAAEATARVMRASPLLEKVNFFAGTVGDVDLPNADIEFVVVGTFSLSGETDGMAGAAAVVVFAASPPKENRGVFAVVVVSMPLPIGGNRGVVALFAASLLPPPPKLKSGGGGAVNEFPLSFGSATAGGANGTAAVGESRLGASGVGANDTLFFAGSGATVGAGGRWNAIESTGGGGGSALAGGGGEDAI